MKQEYKINFTHTELAHGESCEDSIKQIDDAIASFTFPNVDKVVDRVLSIIKKKVEMTRALLQRTNTQRMSVSIVIDLPSWLLSHVELALFEVDHNLCIYYPLANTHDVVLSQFFKSQHSGYNRQNVQILQNLVTELEEQALLDLA